MIPPTARPSASSWKMVLALFLVFWGILIGFQFLCRAFEGSSASYGDEGPHFLNALLIRDYAVRGIGQSPVSFAERFYIGYPKLALFAWPPLFHTSLAGWLLLAGGTLNSAILFISFLTACTASVLFGAVRKAYDTPRALLVAVLFCTLPLTQHFNTVVMLECMLALFSVAFAWQLGNYIDAPSSRNAVLLGALAAACCLTKGNGLASLLSMPLALALSGRFRLCRIRETWIALGLALILSAFPLVLALRFILANVHFDSVGILWMAKSIPAYAKGVLVACTLPVALFVFAGIALTLRPLFSRQFLAPLPAAMLAGIVGVYVFHAAFPHPIDSRYMFTVIPLCLYFLPASLPQRFAGRQNALAVWAIAVLGLYGAFGFSIRRSIPAGFKDAMAYIRKQAGTTPIRAVIGADDSGESAFVVAAAESNSKRNDVIVRSSKLMAESDWFRKRNRHLIDSPSEFLVRAEALGFDYLILDRSRLNKFWELQLMDQAAKDFPGRVVPLTILPAGPDRLRTIALYRFSNASRPPKERVKYRMPYSLGREITEHAP